MVTKKKTTKKTEKETKTVKKTAKKTTKTGLPIISGKPLHARGRTFQGTVTKKLPGRVTIEFERMVRIPKYERYEKRRTKLHARLPEELKEEIQIGSLIEIGETRPISKTIHFIALRTIKNGEQKK